MAALVNSRGCAPSIARRVVFRTRRFRGRTTPPAPRPGASSDVRSTSLIGDIIKQVKEAMATTSRRCLDQSIRDGVIIFLLN
jgi:hypothetical protein